MYYFRICIFELVLKLNMKKLYLEPLFPLFLLSLNLILKLLKVQTAELLFIAATQKTGYPIRLKYKLPTIMQNNAQRQIKPGNVQPFLVTMRPLKAW